VTDERPPIRLIRHDYAQLDGLLNALHPAEASKAASFLREGLARAWVLDSVAVPDGVVVMRSVVLLRDAFEGERVITLVYPSEHRFVEAATSILTPLGAALIGLSEGQSISFENDDGLLRRVTVLRVLYQPTARSR
jgi:regulator of nucleoside diphosphate kinase